MNIIAVMFMVLAGALRLVDHAPNIAAIGALAIWSGAYLNSSYKFSVPVVVML